MTIQLKAPVVITLAVAGATAALIYIKKPPSAPGSNRPAQAPAVQTGSPVADTVVSASSPNLAPPPGRQTQPIGDFVYLFDVSGSTNTHVPDSPFSEALKGLGPAFIALRGLDELMPQRHRVATIGTMSLHAAPRCDIFVTSRTLFTETDSMAPVRAMKACADTLRASASEPYTDISGAVSYAGLSLQGEWKAVRGIVLVSDLKEELAPGTVPAQADLHGMCVAVYAVVTPEVQRDPQLLVMRQKEWRGKLIQWGAKRVRMQTMLGFSGGDLQSFFRNCEDR